MAAHDLKEKTGIVGSSSGGSSAGGLSLVETASNVALAVTNTVYGMNTTAGVLTLTLPGGTTQASIGVIDSLEKFGTNKVTVIPAANQSIGTYAADDTMDLDYTNCSITYYRASGSTVWRHDLQMTSNVPPATATTLGSVMGGAVPGKADGTAVAAGMIGEVISSTIVTQAFTTTETDLAGASLPLTVGVWELCYSLSTQLSSGSGTNPSQYAARTKITTAANVDVALTQRAAFIGNVISLGVNAFMHCSVTITVTTPTTYKIRITGSQPTGTGGSATLYNSPNNPQYTESVYYAKRIG